MCTVLLPPGVYPIAVKYIIHHHTNMFLITILTPVVINT